VHLNFQESSNNTFNEMVANYWGHSKESFDVVYNNISTEQDHVFLKIMCPFYSHYGDDKIDINVTKFQENYNLNRKNNINNNNLKHLN
jgi:hypothetical protein